MGTLVPAVVFWPMEVGLDDENRADSLQVLIVLMKETLKMRLNIMLILSINHQT